MVGISVSGAPHHGPSTARSETPDPNASSLVHRQRGGGGGTSVLSAEALATDLPASDRGNLSALLGHKNVRGHRAAQESVKFLESQQGQDIQKLLGKLKEAMDPKLYDETLARPWKELKREIEKLDTENRLVVDELAKQAPDEVGSHQNDKPQSSSWLATARALLPQLDANSQQVLMAFLFTLLPVTANAGIQTSSMLERVQGCEDLAEEMRSGEAPTCEANVKSEYIDTTGQGFAAYPADAAFTSLSLVSSLLSETRYEQSKELARNEAAAKTVTQNSDTYQPKPNSRWENVKQSFVPNAARMIPPLALGLASAAMIAAVNQFKGKPLNAKEILTPLYVLGGREAIKAFGDLMTNAVSGNPDSGTAKAINKFVQIAAGPAIQVARGPLLDGKAVGLEIGEEVLLGAMRSGTEEISAHFGKHAIEKAGTDHEEKRDTAMHNTMKAVMGMNSALRNPKVTRSYRDHVNAAHGDVDAALLGKSQAELSLRELQGRLADNFRMKPGTQLFSEALEDLGKAREAAEERIKRNTTQPSSLWSTTVGGLRSSVSDWGHALSDRIGQETGNTAASLAGPQNNVQNSEGPSTPPNPAYPAPQAPAAGHDEVIQMNELDNISERSEPATASAVHARSDQRSQMERGGRAEAVLHQPISIPRPSFSAASLSRNPDTAAAGDHRRQRM